jgi:hypothetical protein
MILEYIKTNQRYFTMATAAVAIMLTMATISKAAVSMVRIRKIAPAIESAKTQAVIDEEASKKHLAKFKETAEKLKKENMYTPPQAKPKPPSCTGIIGSRAIINGKGYKVGEKVGGAELLSIGTKDVTVMWDGKETVLPVFSKGGGSPAPRPTMSKPKPGIIKSPTNTITPVRSAPQMSPMGERKQHFGGKTSPAAMRARAARMAAIRAKKKQKDNKLK